MAVRTYTQYLLDLAEQGRHGADCARLLSDIAAAAKLSASTVSRGPLNLELPTDSVQPTVQEVNRGLRRQVTANLLHQVGASEQVAAVSIARDSRIIPVSANGRYLLLFEALHGMKNLVDNLPVGSIFSVLKHDSTTAPVDRRSFLQPGVRQLAAGLVLYGPRTVLVVTTGSGVDGFTLDSAVGNFVLTHPRMSIPPDAPVFAIDPAEAPHWPAPVKRYVEECLTGTAGPRAQDFTMRWNASVLLGAYRVLNRGGMFLIPPTQGSDQWLAPLLHNAAPLAFLAEQAGGLASTGAQRLLEVTPTSLDARTPLFFGSAAEVERIERYFNESSPSGTPETPYPLFHHRSLFAD